MKVKEFKNEVYFHNLTGALDCTESDALVEVEIYNLFFGNRPLSVAADSHLTGWFLSLLNLSTTLLSRSCIIITNTEPQTDDDKQKTPREYVSAHIDEFEIAIQLM